MIEFRNGIPFLIIIYIFISYLIWNLKPKIMIDCSHSNSKKDYRNQQSVFENVINQIINGETSIIGLMLESNINEGKQDLIYSDIDKLKKGVSITDSCISMATTTKIILEAHSLL